MADWPVSLRTVVETTLNSHFPSGLFWGPRLIGIYNDAFEPFVGPDRDAFGQPFETAWSDAWEQVLPLVRQALDGQATFQENLLIPLGPPGAQQDRWFTFSYSPLFDDTGRVAGLLDTVIETTGQVQAHQAAQRERERQQRLLQQMPGFAAVLAGPQHVYEYVNDAYVAIAGVRDYLGRPVRAVFPELEGQGFFEKLDHVYATGEPVRTLAAPIDLVRPGGMVEHNHIDLLFEPIRDAAGAVVGIFVGGHDVTAHVHALAEAERLRRQVEARAAEEGAAARSERDLLAGLMQATGTMMIQALDQDYRFTALNQAAANEYERIYGFRPEVGDDLLALLAGRPDHRAAVRAVWGRALQGEAFTTVGEFGDHERRSYELRLEPVRDAAGHVTSALLTGLDVTERLREQAELLAAQEALQQSQKMEAVGQLTGGIAHDFNNLLAGISGSLQLARVKLQRGHTDGLERHFELGEAAVRRAAALTQRLLAFSRRQTLDPKATDVNRLVAGMEELIRRSVGPGVEVEVVGAGGLWTTKVDPSQLENALLNLCLNARDAMQPQGGRLTIETANKWLDDRAAPDRDLPPGQYISLCVTDTGTGIPPDVVDRIFDPFFTTKPLGQGTGLGLSMVYGFVRQSGGQVRVYSEPGQGTTMCLYLPRHVGAAEADDAAAAADAAARGAGETVLLIEDEASVRAVVSEVLGDAGYRVLLAEDGPAGLRMLQAPGRIDLLVTDVGLPGGLNGRQVADAGRAVRPGLQVLFITGYAENAALGNGLLEAGMQVMTKPFEIAVLVNRVRGMLDAPRA